jgi:molybdopterin-guanine dinucleotide biosynthesis protein A
VYATSVTSDATEPDGEALSTPPAVTNEVTSQDAMRATNQPPLARHAAILVGGASRRMGFPKPLLVPAPTEHPHETLLARTVRICRGAGLSPFLVGQNEALRLAIGSERWLSGVPWLADGLRDQGPLGGLLAALAYVSPRPVVLLPVDLPFLDVGLLETLVRAAPSADAVAWRVPETGRWVPLPARYGPAALAAARAHGAAGQRSLHRVLAAVSTSELTLSPLQRHASIDVDTPDDLARHLPSAQTTEPQPR